MKNNDDIINDELSDYIKRVYEEPGPYQIDSWFLYQLNHSPTLQEIEKADKVLKKMGFNENNEYLITLRATSNHIRNFTLNMIRKIETNLTEFDEVFTEVKQDIENSQDPIS